MNSRHSWQKPAAGKQGPSKAALMLKNHRTAECNRAVLSLVALLAKVVILYKMKHERLTGDQRFLADEHIADKEELPT